MRRRAGDGEQWNGEQCGRFGGVRKNGEECDGVRRNLPTQRATPLKQWRKTRKTCVTLVVKTYKTGKTDKKESFNNKWNSFFTSFTSFIFSPNQFYTSFASFTSLPDADLADLERRALEVTYSPRLCQTTKVTYHLHHSQHSHHPIPPGCLRITRIARLASHRILVSRKSLPAESHGLLANGGIS